MYVIFSCPASGTRFTQSQPKRCGKLGTLFNLQRQCILSRGLTLRPGRVPKEDSGRKRFRRPLRGHVTSLQPGCHDVILARRRLLTLLTSSFSALCTSIARCPLCAAITFGVVSARSPPMFGRCRDGFESHFVCAGCLSPSAE